MKMKRYERYNSKRNFDEQIEVPSPLSNKKIMAAQKKIHEKSQQDKEVSKKGRSNSFLSNNNKDWNDKRIEKEVVQS